VALKIGALFRRKARKPKGERSTVVAPLSELFAHEAPETSPRNANLLPRFKATAGDQVDRQRSDRFTAMRLKLRSAFTPSQPVVDRRMFAGRSGVLGAMIGSLEDQRLHLVIYGSRGIGKTSLLHMLSSAAKDARYIVHYSSCGAASNFQETFRAAAAEIPLLFHNGYGPTAEEAESGANFADLLPKQGFSPRQFGELCGRMTGTRMIIVLDEFDRSESMEFRREIAELIKILSDRSVRVQLIIAGVAGDIAELVEHIPSIRRNILAVRIPLLTKDEAKELVKTGERASGLVFDPAAVDFIVQIASGWPYIASLICHHSGLAAIGASRSTVLPGDVSDALSGAMLELAGRIPKAAQAQAESLKEKGMTKVLTLLAGASLHAGGDFDLSDIDAVAGKSADGAGAKRLVAQLANDRMLIERLDNSDLYGFIDDGLPTYLWFQGAQDEFQSSRKARVSNG
jgi:Cdc6-like AAA superfamily ATPase